MKFLAFVFLMFEAIAFTEDSEDVILKRYIQEGDVTILDPLLTRSTPSEISERLKIIAKSKQLPIAGNSSVIAESLPKVYNSAAAAVEDYLGIIHIVFLEAQLTLETDYLGNKESWKNRLLYINNQGGKWSKPEVLLQNEIYINKLKLLVYDSNVLQLFADGFNESTHNTERGLTPGSYEIFVMEKKNGEWSKPETILSHPRLLHSFDVCLDSYKNLHLVWAPWESNESLELLHYRVRTGSGWQKEEILPEVPNRNATNPKIQYLDGRIHVFAPAQTKDYAEISLYQWKKDDNVWSQPTVIVTRLFDFEFYLTSSAAQLAISIPYTKRFAIYSKDSKKEIKPFVELYLAKDEDDQKNLPFVFGKDNSFVYLVPHKNGILLVSKKLNQQPASIILSDIPVGIYWGGVSILMATENEYIALFNLQDVERKQKLIINRIQINSGNWEPLVDTASRLRGRDGLRESEQCSLTKEVMKQASTAERQNDIRTAINRYLYLIANFRSLKTDCDYSYYAMDQLQRLYQKGSDNDRLQMESAIRKNADKLKELPRILDGLKEIHNCQLEVSKKAFLETPINQQIKEAFENEKKGSNDSPSDYEIKSSRQTINEIKARAMAEGSWRTSYTFGNKCHYGFMKIAELLFDPDPRIRLYAAGALYEYDQQRSLPLLRGLLTDSGCFFPKIIRTNSDVFQEYKAIKISEEMKTLLYWSVN